MSKLLLLLCAAPVCGVLVGCGGKEAALVGVWQATDLKMDAASPLPVTADQLKSQLPKLTLELKPDRHFTMVSESGTWALNGDKIDFTITSINGKTPAEMRKDMETALKSMPQMLKAAEDQMKDHNTGAISADGKTLTVPMGGVTLTFSKKPTV